MLEDAQLTYAYHCCWFRYPQRHDPSAYEEHLKLQEEINRICADKREQQQQLHGGASAAAKQHPSLGGGGGGGGAPTTQSNSDFEGFFDDEQKSSSSSTRVVTVVDFGGQHSDTPTPPTSRPDSPTTAIPVPPSPPPPNNDRSAATTTGMASQFEGGELKKLLLLRDIECGEVAAANTARNISCTPEPDAFNPCEDIMGYSVLRVAVWFVVGASVFGNLSVIVVLGGIFRRLSVPKFLQLNLAIGDLFMGVYLGALALADLTTVGTYFNYAIDWQHGLGCKVAGAASLFASQLSIFSLSVITFERYYTITYSIDLNMRLQLGWAARIMFLGWLYAFASAMLPIFADINSYSKTSICLPMRTAHLADRLFIFVLLFVDSTAFVIIFACYLRMYLLIIRQKTQATAKERTVAMRMALLVSTDFACWAPIIFFSTTALFGWPLISVTNSKILIVFFYPLNSMANPFLYVISTRQYRRDLNYLTTRWSVWRKNLFKRNQDSCYYSNNNPYAVAGNQYVSPTGLNAHLGAVAAVTGVASHPRYKHMGSGGDGHLREGGGVGVGVCEHGKGLNMHEQRVICTKSHQGRYVIRHQILTGVHSGAIEALRGGVGVGAGSRYGSQRQSQQRRATHAPKTGNTRAARARLGEDGDELDWSAASKLALAAQPNQADGLSIEMHVRPKGARDGNEEMSGGKKANTSWGRRAGKHKCGVCSTSSLAICCTRCCCCKSTSELVKSGTVTTVLTTQTSQQPEQQGDKAGLWRSGSGSRPRPPETTADSFVSDLAAAGAQNDAAADRSAARLKSLAKPEPTTKDEQATIESSITILGNISSHAEPTSSYSNYSWYSDQPVEVPAITVRGQREDQREEDEGHRTCRRHNKHRHHCSRHQHHSQDQPANKLSHRHDHSHDHSHDHHHHHHHHRQQQQQDHDDDDTRDNNIETTNSTNPFSSLEPPKEARCHHQQQQQQRDKEPGQQHEQRRQHHHHHRHGHYHRRHRHQRARCSRRAEGSLRTRSNEERQRSDFVGSHQDNGVAAPADRVSTVGNINDSMDKVDKIRMEPPHGDSIVRAAAAAANASASLRKTRSLQENVTKQQQHPGSILKTTLSATDGGASAQERTNRGPAGLANGFIRGGSLKNPRTEKKRVSIVSPLHSG